MAHDAEKLIPRRERIVGQLAFMRKVFVRFLAFARQQCEMLRAFLAKDFVRTGSLLLKDLILTNSLTLEDPRNGRVRRRRAIGLGARCRQYLVRTASSSADDGIGRLIDCASPVLKSLVGFFALDAQTLVGLFALKARLLVRLLVFWRHRCREVYTSPLIVLTSK
ncbi:MAG TPA: hypothetical protein VF836_02160 [Gemmatimonadaceae bacterium]